MMFSADKVFETGAAIRGRQFKKVFSCKTVLDSPMVQYLSGQGHLHFPGSLFKMGANVRKNAVHTVSHF